MATALLAGLCFAATPGCVSTGEDSPETEPSSELRAELEEFCAWWGQLNCELALERAPHRVDAAHCADTETRTCIHGFVAGNALSFAEGRLVYHPEAREELERDLRLQSPESYSEREAMPSWRALFQGTVANGEPCDQREGYGFYVNECADGFCPWGECPGTCRPYPEGDDDCDWDTHRCAPSAYCDEKCVERPGRDEACDPDSDTCLPPLRCRLRSAEARCGVPALLGEPCERTSECQSGACHDGVCALSELDEPCANGSECETELSCLSGVCAPRGSGDGGGSLYRCGSDRDCVKEEMCLSSDQATSCGTPVGLGSGCNPYQGCPMGLVCEADMGGFGVCRVPGDVGDACTGSTCGLGLHCAGWDSESGDEGTCRASSFSALCDPTP